MILSIALIRALHLSSVSSRSFTISSYFCDIARNDKSRTFSSAASLLFLRVAGQLLKLQWSN